MTNKFSSSHIPYRPDIDGLRAIAVLLVIGFHAFPLQFHGGFLGVDIFFVISGYLITSIIFQGMKENSYSLKTFYIKRINRIFPALLLILMFSLILGWFGLTPEEYKELGRHVASAAFFVSNFTLWYQSGYFDVSSDLKPLLHLWSLAVEEQFYVFWPLIMSFFVKRKLDLAKMTLSIIALSFFINLFMSYNYQTGAFYSPVSRFWEILIGAFLALYKLKSDVNGVYDNKKSILGLLLILTSVLLVDKESLFPGFWGLCPTLGTYLIISSSSNSWINKNILSNKLLVWIGLISYPLYLWHWPLFSFANIMTTEPLSFISKVGLVVVSFILSWITYRYFELPLRRIQNLSKKSFVLLLCLLITGLLGIWVKSLKGFDSRDHNKFNTYSNLSSVFAGVSCDSFGLKITSPTYCTKFADSNILLIGDSHAPHLYYGLANNEDPYFSKVSVAAVIGCNGLINYYDDENCKGYIQFVIDVVDNNPSIKHVVLSGSHQVIEGLTIEKSEKYFNGYSEMISRLISKGVKPVFFIDNLALKIDPLKCISSSLTLRRMLFKSPNFCSKVRDEDWLQYHNYDEFVAKLSLKFPDAIFFNPRSLICEEGECSLFKDGKLLYSDVNHYSIYGSLIVGKALVKELNSFHQ